MLYYQTFVSLARHSLTFTKFRRSWYKKPDAIRQYHTSLHKSSITNFEKNRKDIKSVLHLFNIYTIEISKTSLYTSIIKLSIQNCLLITLRLAILRIKIRRQTNLCYVPANLESRLYFIHGNLIFIQNWLQLNLHRLLYDFLSEIANCDWRKIPPASLWFGRKVIRNKCFVSKKKCLFRYVSLIFVAYFVCYISLQICLYETLITTLIWTVK